MVAKNCSEKSEMVCGEAENSESEKALRCD